MTEQPRQDKLRLNPFTDKWEESVLLMDTDAGRLFASPTDDHPPLGILLKMQAAAEKYPDADSKVYCKHGELLLVDFLTHKLEFDVPCCPGEKASPEEFFGDISE